MYSNQHKWIQIAQMTMDCVISILAFILAGIVRFKGLYSFVNTIGFKEILLVIIIGSFISFAVSGMHKAFFQRGYFHELYRVFIYSVFVRKLQLQVEQMGNRVAGDQTA